MSTAQQQQQMNQQHQQQQQHRKGSALWNMTDPRDIKKALSLLAVLLVCWAHYHAFSLHRPQRATLLVLDPYDTTVEGVMYATAAYVLLFSAAAFYVRQLRLLDKIHALKRELQDQRRQTAELQRKFTSFQARARQIVIPASVGSLLERNVDLRSVSAAPVVGAAT